MEHNFEKTDLEDVLFRIPGSVYLKDINGVYLGCNKFQAEMAGFNSAKDIIGKTDYDLPWHMFAGTLRATDQRIMTSGISEELIEEAILSDGRKLVMLTNKSPFYNEKGEIIGIIGTSLDITTLKQQEYKEKATLEEIKRIIMVHAGSIAHDMRTPLVCLRSVGFMLEKVLPMLLKCYDIVCEQQIDTGHTLTPKEMDYIGKIIEIPKTIDAFITDMQNFITDNLKAIQRSTSNNLKEEDLVVCVSYKNISTTLEAYPFKDQEAELIHWDRSYYFNFLGNPILFSRVLWNLLNNALYQIHKNGKGEIFISSEKQDTANIIRFKDTAGGASPEIVNNIFDGYKTTKTEGTGVGLAFCRIIMQSFGGDITCHSVEGDYIEFVLSFPIIDAKN